MENFGFKIKDVKTTVTGTYVGLLTYNNSVLCFVSYDVFTGRLKTRFNYYVSSLGNAVDYILHEDAESYRDAMSKDYQCAQLYKEKLAEIAEKTKVEIDLFDELLDRKIEIVEQKFLTQLFDGMVQDDSED